MDQSKNSECRDCGLLKSTVRATGKPCLKGKWHVFVGEDGTQEAISITRS